MLTALVYALAQSTHRLLFVAFNLSFLKEFANYSSILVRNPKEFSTVLEMHERNYSAYKQAVDNSKGKYCNFIALGHANIYMKGLKKEIEGNCE